MRRLAFIVFGLFAATAHADECGQPGAKHWTTSSKLAAAAVTFHWTGAYEEADVVCEVSFRDTAGHPHKVSVWGLPQIDAKDGLIAFSSCADDGCDLTIHVVDIARGTVEATALPLPKGQQYFSLEWQKNNRRFTVTVEGVGSQPQQHISCIVADKIVCDRVGT